MTRRSAPITFNVDQLLQDYSRELAEEAWTAYVRQVEPKLYLYGQRDDTIYIDVKLSREKLDSYELLIPSPIPCHLPVTALKALIYASLRNKPIVEFLKRREVANGDQSDHSAVGASPP